MEVTPEKFELDISRLTTESKLVASRLFDRLPETRPHARMERSSIPGAFNLVVVMPSPSADPNLYLVVWIENDVTPSLEYGDWHTHVECTREDIDKLIYIAEGILADRIVLIYGPGNPQDRYFELIDLSNRDALLEELTDQYAPDRVKVQSWSGDKNGELRLEDLQFE